MFLKSFGLLAPVAFGGLYVSGALGGGYSRDVARPPAEVRAALADLYITKQPGEPGTDPSRSGGLLPQFRMEQGPDEVRWVVMSGDKVATTMTATLTPLDNGAGTRVTASVSRGDAPDDFVSPAFRSKGVTLGLFGMALEAELDELTAPPRASAETCDAILARFAARNMANADLQRGDNLKDAVGDTAGAVMSIAQTDMEMKRAGCPTLSSNEGFAEVSSSMGPGDGAPGDQVTFEPGKPMVDLGKKN